MYKLKITRDSGANLKILRKLEKDKLIEIYDVKSENETKKVKNKILPVGVWGKTKWGECLWADKKCFYEKIREIIGKENVGDAIKLEAHIRNGFDYFITEDNDFLFNKEKLKRKFNVEIFTPEELEKSLC